MIRFLIRETLALTSITTCIWVVIVWLGVTA